MSMVPDTAVGSIPFSDFFRQHWRLKRPICPWMPSLTLRHSGFSPKHWRVKPRLVAFLFMVPNTDAWKKKKKIDLQATRGGAPMTASEAKTLVTITIKWKRAIHCNPNAAQESFRSFLHDRESRHFEQAKCWVRDLAQHVHYKSNVWHKGRTRSAVRKRAGGSRTTLESAAVTGATLCRVTELREMHTARWESHNNWTLSSS